VLLPIHLIQDYAEARRVRGITPDAIKTSSDFDREYCVSTDGDIDGWTYLSDLNIPSANWINGRNYMPIAPFRFEAALSSLKIRFEDFVFIDFGSGKGRAVLMASEFPFKRVIGVEFAPELHAIAQSNIAKYDPRRKSGPIESVCMDFLDFDLPSGPSVFFFFDPCENAVLARLLARIRQSLEAHPRAAYIVYIAPTPARKSLLDATPWIVKEKDDPETRFCIYGLK
jgi:SAM-dependent methyltransferase